MDLLVAYKTTKSLDGMMMIVTNVNINFENQTQNFRFRFAWENSFSIFSLASLCYKVCYFLSLSTRLLAKVKLFTV